MQIIFRLFLDFTFDFYDFYVILRHIYYIIYKIMSIFNLSKKSQLLAIEWLKKYKKIIEIAKTKWLNESDTSNIINDMLWEVLWYDKFFDVTTEYKIRWQFCDYWVKIDDKLTFLIEVKAISMELNNNHIFQATSYASNEWIKYVVLTNLKNWRLYHLSFWKKIDYDLILDVDLLKEESPIKIIELFKYFHKESFMKNIVDVLYEETKALSDENFKKVILSDVIIKKIQSELKNINWIRSSIEDIESKIKKLFKI